MNRRNNRLTVFIRYYCFGITVAICKDYGYILYRITFCICECCCNSVMVVKYRRLRKLHINLIFSNCDKCSLNRFGFICKEDIDSIYYSFAFCICVVLRKRRNEYFAFAIRCACVLNFIYILNSYCYTLDRLCNRVKNCYSYTVVVADAVTFRKFNTYRTVFIVNYISIRDYTVFIAYYYISFVYIYAAFFVCITITCSRKCNFAVDICFTLFDKVRVTESDDCYTFLCVAVLVLNCNDYRIFSCRLCAFR